MDNRAPVNDLKAIADVGIAARKIVNCNGNTLNTPYKAGLTAALEGTAYINMSSPIYGTILYVTSGNAEIYLLYKNSSGWQNWEKVFLESRLDNRIVVGKDWTAIQTAVADVMYRLQLNANGQLTMYKTTDRGANWTGKTIASFADLQ